MSGIRSEALIGRRSSYIVLAIAFWMTDNRQKARKVKRKRNESLEKAFEFCWSSFADHHNTLPKSTRRNVKLNELAFGTQWLPDLFFIYSFTSSDGVSVCESQTFLCAKRPQRRRARRNGCFRRVVCMRYIQSYIACEQALLATWASEASLARTRERGAEGRRACNDLS